MVSSPSRHYISLSCARYRRAAKKLTGRARDFRSNVTRVVVADTRESRYAIGGDARASELPRKAKCKCRSRQVQFSCTRIGIGRVPFVFVISSSLYQFIPLYIILYQFISLASLVRKTSYAVNNHLPHPYHNVLE